MKVAVLLGGTSAERDVSIASGIAVARACQSRGHDVVAIDCAYGDREIDFMNTDPGQVVQIAPSNLAASRQELDRNILQTVDVLLDRQTEVVFNALHGGYGENGQLQGLLDMVGIAYTGSGAAASAVGMDKHLSKLIFKESGVMTAPWIQLEDPDGVDPEAVAAIGFPLVVKPNAQGSTVGLTIVRNAGELSAAIAHAFQFDSRILVEQFIPGRELTVSVLGGEALPVIEIVPHSGFYDYESKYQKGKTEYRVPAVLGEDLTRAIQSAGRRAYRVLGCRGYARVDFRLDEGGHFWCLELNTLPGMTGTSLVPKAAKAKGIDFPELVERILRYAVGTPEGTSSLIR